MSMLDGIFGTAIVTAALNTRLGTFVGLNLDPVSPATVRGGIAPPIPATGTTDEQAGIYMRLAPTAPGQCGVYLEVPTTQLDTWGSALKVIHRGEGDAVYVACFNTGAGYEAASWHDGSRGFISTLQTSGLPNSMLFVGLWDQADIPNAGAFVAQLVPAHAFTAQKRSGASDGYPQFRVVESDFSVDRWGAYNDGSTAQRSLPATVGTPSRESPELRLIGSEYVSGAAHDVQLTLKVVDGALRVYSTTRLGTALLWQTAANTGELDLQLHDLINCGSVRGLSEVDVYVDGAKVGEIVNPGVTDDSALFLGVWNGSSLDLKRVSQGATNSGGSGYRVLRVPN